MIAVPALPTAAAERPVLLAGPTASGKSALALHLAETQGRTVVNADALQVYGCWRVLTARPGPEDLARAPHALYGHVEAREAYSAGRWLRETAPLLRQRPAPVIVGGTGLYFAALTEGLAEIPPTDPEVRREADRLRQTAGPAALVDALDPATRDRIDLRNPARVQRAWEVQRQTGRGLAEWHARTPAPLMPLSGCLPLVLSAGRDWLARRIETRFDAMLASGALDEVRAMADDWNPARPSAQAIGAAELIAVLRGQTDIATARSAATLATRQYAKRQRSWFRARMQAWTWIAAETLSETLH